MISLKVGSLTALSSKLGLKWAVPAKAGAGETRAEKGPGSAAAVARRAFKRAAPSAFRPKLVLASASPRRLALLEQVGITPDALRPATIDESVSKGEVPRHIVRRLARAKCEAALKLIRADEGLRQGLRARRRYGGRGRPARAGQGRARA